MRLTAALVTSVMIFSSFGSVVFPSSAAEFSAPHLDQSGLLPPKHNPASVPPTGDPLTSDPAKMVPAVRMSDQMRKAILLFDASVESERHYDLINCLDGLTFGFGNWPQPEIGDFFKALMADQKSGEALIKRFHEVFVTNPNAWNAFRQKAGIQTATSSEVDIQAGVERILVNAKMKKAPLKNNANDGSCVPVPLSGVAFYHDNRAWVVPAWSWASRDPQIVSFQVSYWDKDVLKPATANAKALGLPENGTYLMAFYQSNPGQVPTLQGPVKMGKAPESLRAGGKSWSWNTPPANLAGVSLDDWRMLLLWQAMCPAPKSNVKFRIRNRNLAFFAEYLAPKFQLPHETFVKNQHKPAAERVENCDPARARLRVG